MPRKSIKGFKDFKRTHRGFPIIGGSAIVDVINTGIALGTWTPVQMPENVACKQLIISERSHVAWKLSANSDGSAYSTIEDILPMEMAAIPEQVLFYAEGSENGSTEDVGAVLGNNMSDSDMMFGCDGACQCPLNHPTFETGSYIKIDDEICSVLSTLCEAPCTGFGEITLQERGLFGTTPAAHTKEVIVYKYNTGILEIILID